MSTKIYSGLRLVAGADLWEFLQQLRREANVIRDRLDARLLAADAAMIVDRRRIGNPVPDEQPGGRARSAIWEAVDRFKADQDKLGKSDIGHDPHRLELSVGYDPVASRHMLIMYCEATELRELVTGHPDVEEYGYWNNSDQPDGVTDQEWDERRQAWNRVLPGVGIPAETMLTFTLRSHPHAGMTLVGLAGTGINPLLLEQLPTPAERARAMVRVPVAQALGLPGLDPASSEFWDALRQAEHATAVAAAEVARILEPITETDLTAAMPDGRHWEGRIIYEHDQGREVRLRDAIRTAVTRAVADCPQPNAAS